MVSDSSNSGSPGIDLPQTPDAWRALSQKLYRYILRQFQNRRECAADAEELAQEALLVLIRRARGFETCPSGTSSRTQTTSQAFVIAAGLVANKKRSKRRKQRYWTAPERIVERESTDVQLPLDEWVDYRLAVQSLQDDVSNDNAKAAVLRATLLGVRGFSEAAFLGLKRSEFENAKKRLDRLIRKKWQHNSATTNKPQKNLNAQRQKPKSADFY